MRDEMHHISEAKCRCECCGEVREQPFHTSSVVRAWGIEHGWSNLAVCADCWAGWVRHDLPKHRREAH